MNTTVYPALGRLLECPVGNYGSLLQEAWDLLKEDCPEAATSLAQFRETLGDPDGTAAQESYLRAFDIAALCVPYVSVHLFGEENYRRGEFMARFHEAYAKEGFDPGKELPDHLSVLLKFAPKLTGEERRELLELCLKGPLETMRGSLEKAKSPYRLLLQALWETFETDLKGLGPERNIPSPLVGEGEATEALPKVDWVRGDVGSAGATLTRGFRPTLSHPGRGEAERGPLGGSCRDEVSHA